LTQIPKPASNAPPNRTIAGEQGTYMRIASFNFIEREGEPGEWVLHNLSLTSVNLLVGKNASGKSRCLNVIQGLANLLLGQPPKPASATYRVRFADSKRRFGYEIMTKGGNVLAEKFFEVGQAPLLQRGENGAGTIRHDKEDNTFEFQLPTSQVAAFVRQDAIQHPFLAPLYEWASGTYHYPFGTDMGKSNLLVIPSTAASSAPTEGSIVPTYHDVNRTLEVFRQGNIRFKKRFRDEIIRGMNYLGYYISDIGLMTPTTLVLSTPSPVPIEPFCLYVQEKSLPAPTEQVEMSQGMFRALSTLINISYGRLSKSVQCILIDDIGEGLDFERSTALIKLIIQRTAGSKIQLIMSTNDRFVMNSVPLKYWSIINRKGSHVSFHNSRNSRQKFEEFRFTGLNNFDLFSSNFIFEEE
jgi:hypothetical protein